MAVRRLGLTRDQLAAFLKEHEQIRQFELLFTAVDELQTGGVDSVTFDAGTALAGVNRLSGIVAQLADDGAIEASTALSVAQSAQRALDAIAEMAMVGATRPPLVPQSQDLAMLGATAPPERPESKDLAMIGATLPPLVPKRRNVGAWHDMTRQVITGAGVPKLIQCNTVDIERGIWLDTGKFFVADTGIYNVEFSAQVDRNKGTDSEIWFWIAINGTDVPETASVMRIKGNDAELVASWNFLIELEANASVAIVWTADDVDTYLETFAAAGAVPAIPSVIVTITQEA